MSKTQSQLSNLLTNIQEPSLWSIKSFGQDFSALIGADAFGTLLFSLPSIYQFSFLNKPRSYNSYRICLTDHIGHFQGIIMLGLLQ